MKSRTDATTIRVHDDTTGDDKDATTAQLVHAMIIPGGSGIRASPNKTNSFVLESGSPLVDWLAHVRVGSMSGMRLKQLARQPVLFVPHPS